MIFQDTKTTTIMKTFKDLEFKKTPKVKGVQSAYQYFGNGNFALIAGGGCTFGDGINTFEVWDQKDNLKAYQTKEQVTEIMKQLQR